MVGKEPPADVAFLRLEDFVFNAEVLEDHGCIQACSSRADDSHLVRPLVGTPVLGLNSLGIIGRVNEVWLNVFVEGVKPKDALVLLDDIAGVFFADKPGRKVLRHHQ